MPAPRAALILRHPAALAAAALLLALAGGCGDGSTTMPTDVAVPRTPPPTAEPVATCSVALDSTGLDERLPIRPADSQAEACASNERPRLVDVIAARRGPDGVAVEGDVVDGDARTLCQITLIDERGLGGGCGGGRFGSFQSRVTFPLTVRVVAWDDRGCLAEPVCLRVN
jgi:hypothetical protein